MMNHNERGTWHIDNKAAGFDFRRSRFKKRPAVEVVKEIALRPQFCKTIYTTRASTVAGEYHKFETSWNDGRAQGQKLKDM